MKTLHFLSGLPRTGSTLLGSILTQNENVTVTPTSPILDLLCYLELSLSATEKTYTYDTTIHPKLYRSFVDTFYQQYKDDIIIDKHRGWPKNVKSLTYFLNINPKIICTIRPISEIISSYIKLIIQQPGKNFIDEKLTEKHKALSIENRAELLWDDYISDPYRSMLHGIRYHRENLLIIDYNQMMKDPEGILKRINQYLELPQKDYDFNNIINHCAEEKDEAWGLKNLHDIRPILKRESTPPEDILGNYLKKKYDAFNLTC